MEEKHSGSCLCGQVKFEIAGTFESFFLCHCKYCQKDTGSAHAANLFSTSAQLIWKAGTDQVKTFNLPTTRHMKSFCKECGSALPNLQMDGKLVVVPAGSLDTEIAIKPNAHLFCSSRAPWSNGLETIKKFEKLPS
ncbi:GFA family protein [Bdellovibrio sp. HCB290]|uniref:GFA family protein n=1 Tax=Bdellovibrio sp. HCB290 TaxID=3394356 RepID=UPI0039B67A5F